MGDNSQRHGIFSLHELLTTDLTAAQEFYGALLGWTFTEVKNLSGNPYIVIHNAGEFIGGMMLKDEFDIPADAPPLWDPYITVADVEDAATRVAELGGKVVLPPTDIPQLGRFCVIKDPQGASLNLITYEDKS